MSETFPRNTGTSLKPDWFEDVVVNRSASERRASSLPSRRSIKKEYQAAWLVRAIQCIDLTTLAGDDTEGRVRRLCAKARRPVRDDILEALGLAVSSTIAVTPAGVELNDTLVVLPEGAAEVVWLSA